MGKELKDYTSLSLRGFIDEISSDYPVPGGGSVSAYVATLGLALLKKTLVFTLKKDIDEQVRSDIKALLEEADRLLEEFFTLVNEDSKVFLECLKDKGKSAKERFAPAREVAQKICDLCHKAYKIHAKGSYLYNKSMRADYEASQRLIDAAFRISWENAHYAEES